MGQGTESCGGYELEYDPYDSCESRSFSVWHGKDGDYKVSEMSVSHMKNSIRLCVAMKKTASCSYDEEKWQEWIDVFEDEIRTRALSPESKKTPNKKPIRSASRVEKKPVRGAKKEVTCHCGKKFLARVADIKRGWGKSCSKSCAAIARN